ncbi:MAG: PstS family phosphate ABC transporter substrate-binding protein [Planctomycetota bacterium]
MLLRLTPSPVRATRVGGPRRVGTTGLALGAVALLLAGCGSGDGTATPPAADPAGAERAPALQLPIVAGEPRQWDLSLPEYQPVAGVDGGLKTVGSDTMSNLLALWGEGFARHYPNVELGIEESGSNTAPPALIEGTANLGPMSRRMQPGEVEAFVARFGYEPTAMAVAIDCLTIFVHKDNPLARRGLVLDEVDSLFSRTRRGGMGPIHTWGDLGLVGAWANKPISLYGRTSSSGTYALFKRTAMFGGDFKETVKEQPGSSAVVSGVARDKLAIGYSGVGYLTADVAPVPLRRVDDRAFFMPSAANAYEGHYPLARYLWVYINRKPNSEVDPLQREFLRFIYSREGQAQVREAGYLPVTAAVAQRQLEQLGLQLDSARPTEGGR